MEFLDNTGHIFSLPSYNEKPIGYEYDELPYIFWLDSSTSKLSINNYYSRPIYILYLLNKDYKLSELNSSSSPLEISIEINNSNVYKLISSTKLNEYISSDKYNDLNDYIDLGHIDDETSDIFFKTKLTNNDILGIKTTETVTTKDQLTSEFDYLIIPIYPIACAKEEGVWITNILIHIYDTITETDEWCPISVGGEFINEYEELLINGKNIGVNLPKDILKAVYEESLYNDEFNESLYNEKLKEYLLNKNVIRSECGNFNSAIASLKWFGYGDKISIAKLLKTDNTSKNQYLLDFFNIKNDVIEAFKLFQTSALISLKLMINKETDELYPFDTDNNESINIKHNCKYYKFFGENKPKMLSLIDYYEKIKIGNHDMPIEEDDEKYWYYKPYFDFALNELGIKLACLKYFYKQYFLPIHLYIHDASLGYRVFSNDIKYTITTGVSMSEPIISLNVKNNEVEFNDKNTYYFTKQVHYVDGYFNEFTVDNIEDDNRTWYEINDTCVNIPIKFISNDLNKGYFNCVFLLINRNISDEPLYESHFIFNQSEKFTYKNFIIYPKKLNVEVTGKLNNINIKSNFFEYWIDDNFILKILVNNKWYEYKFRLKIHNPTLDFGTLRYRYYLNDHNYLLNRVSEDNENNNVHSLIFTDEVDKINSFNGNRINIDLTYENDPLKIAYFNDTLYELIGLDGYRSFIKTLDLSNVDELWEYFESNYDILSPFTQLSRIDDFNKMISFNAYMHNCELVNVNNIDFDIDFFKILKYHLDHNLLYIDGTLLNKEFYQFILYRYSYSDNVEREIEILLHKDIIGKDIEIPCDYFNRDKIIVCAWLDRLYILEETGEHTNTYFINVLNDNNSIIISEGDLEDSYALLYNSVTLYYNQEFNSYIRKDDDGVEVETYPIYDKLYNNIDYINRIYNSEINLPNLDNYKNSLHLFNIYTSERVEQNILVFHNDIDVYVNGLQFRTNKYNYRNEYESLKIYISGEPKKDIDTRFIDIYGLHLIEPYIEDGKIINIPEEIRLHNYEYGLYVKRDYTQHYNDGVQIYDLPNIFEYDTTEFSYYVENQNVYMGSIYYQTLDDFYNDKRIKTELLEDYEGANIFKDDIYIKNGYWVINNQLTNIKANDEYKPFIKDNYWYVYDSLTDEEINTNVQKSNTYYFYDLNVKDLSDLSKYYKNKLLYGIKFYDENDEELTGISINNITNDIYKYIKINLYYKMPHIVRNRFYLLVDYIKEYAEQGYSFEFTDELHILIKEQNNVIANIPLFKLSPKYMYHDDINNNYISIQNPSYYWFNLDNNSIKSLPSYYNELERYAYTGNDTLEDLINSLEEYKRKFIYNQTADDYYLNDSEEARYNFINYLQKDFTGRKGTYKLTLDSDFIDDYTIRLVLEVFDENNNRIIYTNKSGEFVLNGKEKCVTLYFQLNEFNCENVNNWVVAQMLEISNVDKQLEYDYEKCGSDHIVVKILNKEYYYGNNRNEYVYNLYKDFFKLKYNIYDSYINDNKLNIKLLNSIYDVNDNIKLNMYLNYDFYLMHDDKYWYGLYISRETCDKISKLSDLIYKEKTDNNGDIKYMNFFGNYSNKHYILKYEKSSKEYLINRLEFISSNGFNQFKDDDIVCCHVTSNDRLPFNPYISSKWSISPMSLGMSTESKFESNAEMTILSIPKNDNKYQRGYYKATVKYSLDRDIQHQFKNTSTIKIS